MKNINKQELLKINGGINWSGTFIGNLTKAINTIADLGRSLGTAIRRVGNGSVCPL